MCYVVFAGWDSASEPGPRWWERLPSFNDSALIQPSVPEHAAAGYDLFIWDAAGAGVESLRRAALTTMASDSLE